MKNNKIEHQILNTTLTESSIMIIKSMLKQIQCLILY